MSDDTQIAHKAIAGVHMQLLMHYFKRADLLVENVHVLMESIG